MAWEAYSEIVEDARDKVKEAKAHLEVRPHSKNKDNRKSFYRYVENK